jgi:hypothetical protein
VNAQQKARNLRQNSETMIELKKGVGGKRVKGCTQIRVLLAHETYQWVAVKLAMDRRGRNEKPTVSHVVERLVKFGFEVLATGVKPTFVERKVRGYVECMNDEGHFVEFYCPPAMKAKLVALRHDVNAGAYPSIAPTKKGVCVSNIVRRLVELAIEGIESPPVKL